MALAAPHLLSAPTHPYLSHIQEGRGQSSMVDGALTLSSTHSTKQVLGLSYSSSTRLFCVSAFDTTWCRCPIGHYRQRALNIHFGPLTMYSCLFFVWYPHLSSDLLHLFSKSSLNFFFLLHRWILLRGLCHPPKKCLWVSFAQPAL